MTTANWGAVVLIDPPTEDNDNDITVYNIHQEKLQLIFPPAKPDDRPLAGSKFSYGPLSVDFRVDFQKKEFAVSASIMGIGLGTFYGSFTRGIELKVNLLLAKGSLRFYVKNSALWVRIDVDIKFDGGYHEDKKIYGWA